MMVRKIAISMLLLGFLVACTKKPRGTGSDELPPVLLSACIPVTTVLAYSRAPVEIGDRFTATVGGWESSGAVDYTAAPTWQSTAEVLVAPTALATALIPQPFYSVNGNIKTYVKAWYPAGTLTNGVVSFTNTNGTVDVLLAAGIEGSKNDSEGKVLVFNHKTTQLKFKVVADATLAPGTTISKITVLGAQVPTGVDLTTGSVNFAAAAALDLPGLTTTVIPATATLMGEPVMIKSMTGNTIRLNIVTSLATFIGAEAKIAGDENFLEGKAYTITLTFKQKTVELTAVVSEWIQGVGAAELEIIP
ncbi:MAG: fimbrillin family protein [Odoribacteraceae bacterium]|jgi:hypothetical protein|nr:fimbrillin family protein [Odoribacteraceae bacterium]